MTNDPKQSENRERLKSAVLAIKTLQARLAAAESDVREPIAVIGMGCRFPGGAIDPESYWRLLRDGRNGMCEIPGWRWPVEEFYSDDPNVPGKMYVQRAGFVEGIENFDADFFGISAREALRLDPQQRLLLEVSWEALEDAGIAPGELAGSSTGVFVGITYSDYGEVLHDAGSEYIDTYYLTGSCLNFAPGRIAYYLGLQGPALAIDSACSSSLVAVDAACRSLRTRQCDLALSGGVNAMLSPEAFVTRCKARMLSADGVCRTFDASANGFARGEGAGIIVLKRLADAQADGDRILAVILGSAVNQDGKTSGLTVPNRHAQEAVIRRALDSAGVATTDIQYVEAHGTATPLGDPIEVRALANVFGPGRSMADPVHIGSVKTNIGHLESAAGIAGLLKAILALGHREIPPHLNLRSLTPHVQWDEIPVRVPTSLTPWPAGVTRRVAGVSSFGASGTNSHIVVAEAPAPPASATASVRPLHLLTVSARTDSALRAAVARLASHLEANPELPIADVCHTANTGRTHFPHRASLLCSNTREACEKLRGGFSASLAAGMMVSRAPMRERPQATPDDRPTPPPPDASSSDWAAALADIQARYHVGTPIDWKSLDRGFAARTISLPTYPFERERFWVELDRSATRPGRAAPTAPAKNQHPLLGAPLSSPAIEGSVFEAGLDAQDPAFLQHHKICGRVVMPATAYIEMALAAARPSFGQRPYQIDSLVFQEVLPLAAETRTKVQFVLRPAGSDAFTFEVYSTASPDEHAAWTRHAAGKLTKFATGLASNGTADLAAIRARCSEPVNVTAFYETLREKGIDFGPAFRNLRALFRGKGESLAEVKLADGAGASERPFLFHPALLDACFQAAAGSILSESADGAAGEVLLPVGIESLRLIREVPGVLWTHSTLRRTSDDARTSILDLEILDQRGQIVCNVSGLELKWVNRSAVEPNRRGDAPDWLYEIQWRKIAASEKADSESNEGLHRPGTWLILADAKGLGEALPLKLSSLGHHCILVRPGSSFLRRGNDNFAINPAHPADFMELIEAVGASRLHGVLHLWSLDAASSGEMTPPDLDRAQMLSCGAALHLVQALALSRIDAPPRLHFVTRGTQAVRQSAAPVAAATAGLWGLGRVIAAEHPELHCQRIDLDPENPRIDQDARSLLEVLRYQSAQDEIAVRQGSLWTPRLAPLPLPQAFSEPVSQTSRPPVQLRISNPGMLENLSWVPTERVSPAVDDVEIEVRGAGLNFRDVLCALGMYPGKVERLGGECAGIVARVGPNVRAFQPGDAVMALAPGGLGTYVNVRADFVAPAPRGVNFKDAACIPVVFLTALYGLQSLGRIKSGDRVLIHAAAGGVGLAAVQMAQRAGAEIFATAGSPEKREFLRRIGISHIYDSRSLEFADAIKRDTNGRGVDIVLNSLAGEFIPKSVSVLASGGRFLELGKRGILTREEFAAQRPDCEFYSFDLGDEAYKDPSLAPALFAELRSAFEQGTLHPLPGKEFEMAQTVDAFRYMAQAKQIGKIVITGFASDVGGSACSATFFGPISGPQRRYVPHYRRPSRIGPGGRALACARRRAEPGPD